MLDVLDVLFVRHLNLPSVGHPKGMLILYHVIQYIKLYVYTVYMLTFLIKSSNV